MRGRSRSRSPTPWGLRSCERQIPHTRIPEASTHCVKAFAFLRGVFDEVGAIAESLGQTPFFILDLPPYHLQLLSGVTSWNFSSRRQRIRCWTLKSPTNQYRI